MVNLSENLQANTYGLYNYTYKVKKNPPRKACSRQPPRGAAARFAFARITMVSLIKKVRETALVGFLMYYSIVRFKVATARVAKMAISQGCHSRRFFLFCIYVLI